MGRFFWNDIAVTAVAHSALKDALVEEAELIGAVSQQVAPRKTGAMRGTARIDDTDENLVSVTYGGESAPYAAVQERGINPRTGAPFVAYTTPGTGPHYLKTGFDGVVASQLQAFSKRLEQKVRNRLRMTP
jgi:hypothetical protein